MNEALLILGMAIATFSIRYVMFGSSSQITLSPALLNALRYVPPVVLTAIVVPEVLLSGGHLSVSYLNARLVGAIAAVITSALTQNLLLTILIGMSVFWSWPLVLMYL